MTTPRSHDRVSPVPPQPKLATIISDPAVAPIVCTIVDYSVGGACLQVSGESALPEHFELLYGADHKACRRVWTRGERVGVVF